MKIRVGALVLLTIGPLFGREPDLRLPDPPSQGTSWVLSANIPTNLLSAGTTLFEQGFPDPRGCEYREMEIEVSGIWDGKKSTARTRGWLLPQEPRDTNRFAISWNGLIYPVTKIGAPADLHAEAATLMPRMVPHFDSAQGEITSVFSTNSLSTRALLLLGCGETEAALRNWVPGPQPRMRVNQAPMDIQKAGDYDPYLEMAGDWAWALLDRTVCAHTRGDGALALATARMLLAAQTKIEVEAAKRGFRRSTYYDSARQGKEKHYLDFLEQLPELLTDLERRAREGWPVPAAASELKGIPRTADRITALIREIEFIQARQMSQPGWVNFAEDPIVSALINEGDAAVDPLLDCMEKDKRLTRSVGFHRDFFRNRTVIRVSNPARAALQSILHGEFRGGVAEMRAYWNKYKSLKLEERWFAILNDESTGMQAWAEVAGNITQPITIQKFPGTGFSVERLAPTNAPVQMLGESLRAHSRPSVSELLAQRSTQIPSSDPSTYDLIVACEIGLCLLKWDAAAALPTAKALAQRCRTVLQYSDRPDSWPGQRIGAGLTRLALARAQRGDAQAFEEYASWIQTTRPDQLENSLWDCLEPLRKDATNATLRFAADHLFSNTNSDWSKLPWKEAGSHNPVESELINIPAFRLLVTRELKRTEACGSVEWRDPSTVIFHLTNYMSGSRALTIPQNEHPANGTKAELRWCDWIAWSVANTKQIPAFNPFAPIEKRDEAIEYAKTQLSKL